MIAFDTNMLVRLLVDDHPEQAALAQRLLADNTALIPPAAGVTVRNLVSNQARRLG